VVLSHKVKEPANFPFWVEVGWGWGGACPRVIAFRPGETSYVINFGDYLEGCVYGGLTDPLDGAPAADQQCFYGHAISLANGTSLLFSLRNSRDPTNRFKTYEIRDTVVGVAAPRIYFPTQCEDGVDNNGNQLTDWPNDPGCVNAADVSEKPIPCDDGVDNDEDGAVDYLDDIGCRDLWGMIENPQCSDGLDNDLDTLIDFDGGEWIHGTALTDPDPQCVAAWDNNEWGKTGCGAPTVQAADDARGLMALAPLAIAVLALLGYGIVRNRRAS
jgi:hypothetical protein